MRDGLEIRRASRSEVDTLVDWAAQEGWNPGLEDAACFHATDPRGFWVARLGGTAVAGLSLVSYGVDFAFLGFYIVRPDTRRRGIGYATWRRALDACGATTVGLDGVVDQQDNYRKSGFALAHRNVRYAGAVDIGEPDMCGLTRIGPILADAVAAYDSAFFPGPRRDFVAAWLAAVNHVGFAVVDDDRITGYGVIRPCRSGYKIGPLFADDDATAERLFRALAAEAVEGPVYLDPPEPNTAAAALCQRYGMTPTFETARMYRGPVPDLPLDRIYGITTFELG